MLKVEKRQAEKQELLSRKDEHFCRYLGLVALALDRQTTREHLEQQVITELAESLDAEMGTHSRPIELLVVEGELCDQDGRSMTASAESWREAQLMRAIHNPNLEWFAGFATQEAQEHNDVVEFNRAANPGDTLLVISPFPEEAYESQRTRATVALEGFRPDLRRSFIRAYEKTDKGLLEHIQSIDSSDLAAWNKTLEHHFNKAPLSSTEQILSQRTVCESTSAKELVERIAMTYDEVMYDTTGKVHKYGRSPSGFVEANQFVRNHMAIVHDTIAELSDIKNSGHQADLEADKIMYKSKALIKVLLNSDKQYTLSEVRLARGAAGSAAAATGEVFYGCSGANSAVAEQAQQLSHTSSLSQRNGLEEVPIGSCPVCGKECITGIRDTKTKRFVSCTNKKCRAYNQSKINQIRGTKGAGEPKSFTQLFEDLLEGVFNSKKTK